MHDKGISRAGTVNLQCWVLLLHKHTNAHATKMACK